MDNTKEFYELMRQGYLSTSQRAVIAAKLSNVPKHINKTDPRDISQMEAAKMLNVSSRTIRTIKQIEREKPELIKKIAKGEMTAHEAIKQIRKQKLFQNVKTNKKGEKINE